MKKLYTKDLSFFLIVLLLSASMLLSGCGTTKHAPALLTNNGSKTQNEKYPETDGTTPAFSQGMNRFALKLYDKLDKEGNLFFSPYSISAALSMLANGAGGDTRDELISLLGCEDLASWNQQMRYFSSGFCDEKAVLNTANSIWFSKKMHMKETAGKDFFQPVSHYYQAELYQADFKDRDTLKQINRWVSDHTGHMIDPFLNELDTELVMCLVNAVYFNGEWSDKFKNEDTGKQTFHGTKDMTADMMNKRGSSFSYVEKKGLKGISLPYGSGSIAMDIWIPSEDSTSNTRDLFDALAAEDKLLLIQELADAEPVDIHLLALPKFSLESPFMELNEILKSLGMVTGFDSLKADFGLLDDDLYVSLIGHKAKIEVDEEGSRAAAATAVMCNDGGAMLPENTTDFIADRPFVFFLRDCSTDVILFMGYVENIEN